MAANEEVARIFERMARVLSLKGASRFRILAYQRAAMSLRDLRDDLAGVAAEGRLREIPGIGEDLSAMIAEYLKSGRILRCEEEKRGYSDALIDLLGIPGLGPKTLAMLHDKLGVDGLDDLRRALDSKTLLEMPGFGEKKAANLRRSLELWTGGLARMPLGVAAPLAEKLLALALKSPGVEKASLTGSLRRGKETIGDVDLLVASQDSAKALEALSQLPVVKEVTALGGTRASLRMEGGIQVDIRAVEEDSYGAALQYFTGSKEHNVHLRTLGRERGLKINEYGVFRGEKRIGGREEEDVYRALGLPWIPPELREDSGEIEAARKGRLPRLIELGDIRGDLHVHTDYSDGRASMEEMVEQARRMGYEYVGLADHSPSQRIARGLGQGRLEEKMAEVEKARRRTGFPILMGAEVDILPRGELDYPDDLLGALDLVIAAVHGSFHQPRDRMTGRMLDALDHPAVRVLAHPTCRLLGSREPIDFDFDRVVDKARRNHVALEINGSYLRMDLPDGMARRAAAAGALLAIGSDAHSIAQMDGVRYGVRQARRGWVEAAAVVNTWSWAALRRWLRKGSVPHAGAA